MLFYALRVLFPTAFRPNPIAPNSPITRLLPGRVLPHRRRRFRRARGVRAGDARVLGLHESARQRLEHAVPASFSRLTPWRQVVLVRVALAGGARGACFKVRVFEGWHLAAELLFLQTKHTNPTKNNKRPASRRPSCSRRRMRARSTLCLWPILKRTQLTRPPRPRPMAASAAPLPLDKYRGLQHMSFVLTRVDISTRKKKGTESSGAIKFW